MPEFQVRKNDVAQCRVVDASLDESQPLSGKSVRARIDRFAFTANNVTYAATGEQLSYWQFFPASVDSGDWGLVPAWGFATVVSSSVDELPIGERLFGFWPTAEYLDLEPVGITATRFRDDVEHRRSLPPAYNGYTRVTAEPGYDPATDDARMLLWPLYVTSWCLWDALADNDWYGAEQVMIVSASSKTSIGLAFALASDGAAPPAIGLTSSRNLEFIQNLGLYRQCTSYEQLADLDATLPTVIVDMAGNDGLTGRLHTQLGDNMRFHLKVGLTHWDETSQGEGIITERSKFFFAPSHVAKRIADWGMDAFNDKTSAFLARGAAQSQDWLEIRTISGLRGLEKIYGDICAGRAVPQQGIIVSPGG